MAAGTITLGDALTVNRLGFGAMRLTGDGVWGPPADRDEARRVLCRAIELGVNFIDTADSYGPHVADEIIAEALAPYPPGLVIATKAGFERPGPGQWVTNGRPDHLRASCDASLRRLRVDRIDLFQLHRVDTKVPEADQFGTLAELRAAGKIHLVGLSEVDVETITRARQVVPIASVQNKYNVADRTWEAVVSYCEREAIAFIPWYPLAAGALSAEVLDRIASRHDATRWQVAIAWLLARSPIMLPIPGTSQTRHLEDNLASAALELSSADMRELNQIAGG